MEDRDGARDRETRVREREFQKGRDREREKREGKLRERRAGDWSHVGGPRNRP